MNMDHMKHLRAIVLGDVAVLEKKEATYQGSWKKSGGRSAWFMAKRNLDRLMNMLAPYTATLSPGAFQDGKVVLSVKEFEDVQRQLRSEDIFAAIEADPSGADGTVLAVVRDARRYFTLVEAEMVARGIVSVEGITQTEVLHHDTGTILTNTRRAGESDEEAAKRTARRGEPLPDEETQLLPQVTPLDGSQHSSLVPWAVSTRWRYSNGFQAGGPMQKVFDKWWKQQAPGVYVLEPAVHMDAGTIPLHLISVYDNVGTHRVLKIASCPPDARDWFPSIRREVNTIERSELPEWQRDMYRWHESGTKWVLEPQHSAWERA